MASVDTPIPVVVVLPRHPRQPARAGFTLVKLPAVSQGKRAGFTLVELLVVIGIIALLVAILMPALSVARQHAEKVQCMSNLRQFGMGLKLYAHNFEGVIPGRQFTNNPPSTAPWTRSSWPTGTLFHRYLGGIPNSISDANVTLAAQNKLRCPSLPWGGNDNWSEAYAYPLFHWVFLNRLRNPAYIFVAGDSSRSDKGSLGLMYDTMNTSGTIVTPPDTPLWFGHRSTATMLFADGHVDAMRREQVPVWRDQGVKRFPGYTAMWNSIRGKQEDGTPYGF